MCHWMSSSHREGVRTRSRTRHNRRGWITLRLLTGLMITGLTTSLIVLRCVIPQGCPAPTPATLTTTLDHAAPDATAASQATSASSQQRAASQNEVASQNKVASQSEVASQKMVARTTASPCGSIGEALNPFAHQGPSAARLLQVMQFEVDAVRGDSLALRHPGFRQQALTDGQVAAAELLAPGLQAASFGFLTPPRRQQDPWNQFSGRRSRRGSSRDDRNGVPTWDMDRRFENDVFRFVRVKYRSWGGRRYHRMGRWATDFPDSDLNFSWRLQQLTAIKVDPEPLFLELTDERLFDYPFLYMIEPGALFFSEQEVTALRRYLLNGGFMMVDDFWGSREYDNFYSEIKRVFPDREPEELDISHPIFHYVYDLKKKPQVPSIHHWMYTGGSSERGWDSDEVHYRAIKDDAGRIMVLICHNTDLGDGWEREGESREYFQLFSEKQAYPMGINIILYAMTH